MTQYQYAEEAQVACDGCGIAKDDLRDLEMLHRRDEIWQELFRNASRIRKAMRGNAWLRPIFRKYKEVCREILDQKNKEATVFTQMGNYCDAAGDANDLKRIREELEQIHAQIAAMGGNDGDGDDDGDDDDSTSSSEMSDDSDNEGNEDEGNEDEGNEDNEDNDSVSSSSSSSSSLSSSSSSSSSSLKKRMEDFV
jgi:hypothetical protein